MKKKKHIVVLTCIVVYTLVFMTGIASGIEIQDTSLFVDTDKNWEHKQAGDTFVVRTDVENIGGSEAICVFVSLDEIPDDWEVSPKRYIEPLVDPGEKITRYFIIERGETDSTIYASAQAFNANKVISEKIPIPISPLVVLCLCVVFGAVVVIRKQVVRDNKTQQP